MQVENIGWRTRTASFASGRAGSGCGRAGGDGDAGALGAVPPPGGRATADRDPLRDAVKELPQPESVTSTSRSLTSSGLSALSRRAQLRGHAAHGSGGGLSLRRRLPPPHRSQHLGEPGGSPPPAGATGLYHVASLYPTRAAFADALRRLRAADIRSRARPPTASARRSTCATLTATASSSTGTGRPPSCREPPRASWRCTRGGSSSRTSSARPTWSDLNP
jgi:hypothetical protein